MGCTSSSLKGSSFADIDAARRHSHAGNDMHVEHHKSLSYSPDIYDPTQQAEESANATLSEKGHRHSTHSYGETGRDSYDGDDNTRPSKSKSKSRSKYKSQSKSTSNTSMNDNNSINISNKQTTTTAAAPLASNTKASKPSLYSRYQARKMGVPEPRDPETGRGLYTGMTLEEIKRTVERTRPAGTAAFGDGGGGSAGWA